MAIISKRLWINIIVENSLRISKDDHFKSKTGIHIGLDYYFSSGIHSVGHLRSLNINLLLQLPFLQVDGKRTRKAIYVPDQKVEEEGRAGKGDEESDNEIYDVGNAGIVPVFIVDFSSSAPVGSGDLDGP